MSDLEFEQRGHHYRAGKLNTFQQFHLSRKIAPLIPALVPVFLSVAKMPGTLKDNIGQVAALMQPFADGLAQLPDADAEYVMSTCLSVVRRKTTQDVWAPVWSASANALMFDDMDLGVAMPIAIRVIQVNLGPFIQGLLTSQQETSPAAAPVE